MGKLFYIVGKSSTGKDTILKALTEDENTGLKEIIQYTTRPMREGEKEGREYHFISSEEALKLREEGKIIEERSYNTVHGIWKYMMVDDGKFDMEAHNYVAVGPLPALSQILKYFGRANVVPIYIYVENGERLLRALNREKKSPNPKYAEMCRRFLADESDFDMANLKEVGLVNESGEYINGFENRELPQCIEDIKRFIKDKIS